MAERAATPAPPTGDEEVCARCGAGHPGFRIGRFALRGEMGTPLCAHCFFAGERRAAGTAEEVVNE